MTGRTNKFICSLVTERKCEIDSQGAQRWPVVCFGAGLPGFHKPLKNITKSGFVEGKFFPGSQVKYGPVRSSYH